MLNKKFYALCMFLTPSLLWTRDTLIEFKGAGFFPTNNIYKDIYGKTGTYGFEGTFRLNCLNFYGFASVNVAHQKGISLGQCNATKVDLLGIGVGLKYLIPFCCGDFYAGLGFNPVRITTKDCSPFVNYNNSKWGLGGGSKLGIFFDIPCNFFFDLFLDYSFVKATFTCTQAPTGYVQPHNAHINAVIFGAGFGYRFN